MHLTVHRHDVAVDGLTWLLLSRSIPFVVPKSVAEKRCGLRRLRWFCSLCQMSVRLIINLASLAAFILVPQTYLFNIQQQLPLNTLLIVSYFRFQLLTTRAGLGVIHSLVHIAPMSGRSGRSSRGRGQPASGSSTGGSRGVNVRGGRAGASGSSGRGLSTDNLRGDSSTASSSNVRGSSSGNIRGGAAGAVGGPAGPSASPDSSDDDSPGPDDRMDVDQSEHARPARAQPSNYYGELRRELADIPQFRTFDRRMEETGPEARTGGSPPEGIEPHERARRPQGHSVEQAWDAGMNRVILSEAHTAPETPPASDLGRRPPRPPAQPQYERMNEPSPPPAQLQDERMNEPSPPAAQRQYGRTNDSLEPGPIGSQYSIPMTVIPRGRSQGLRRRRRGSQVEVSTEATGPSFLVGDRVQVMEPFVSSRDPRRMQSRAAGEGIPGQLYQPLPGELYQPPPGQPLLPPPGQPFQAPSGQVPQPSLGYHFEPIPGQQQLNAPGFSSSRHRGNNHWVECGNNPKMYKHSRVSSLVSRDHLQCKARGSNSIQAINSL